MAPPTRLTPIVQRRICAFVKAGASVKVAAPAAGIPWDTARHWLEKGKQGVAPFADFVTAIERAKARWAARMIGKVNSASDEDWRAATYLLERRIPGFWKPQEAPRDADRERVILLYPVAMPLGAEPQRTPLVLPGQAFDKAIDVEPEPDE